MAEIEKNTSSAVAIVTGGNSGIGESIARMLAERNFTVVVAGRRDEENERVAAALRAGDRGDGRAFRADVSREEDCVRLVREVHEEHGRLDLLVNNAGVGGMMPIVESTTEDLDRVLKTNFHSAYWCSREAFRLWEPGEAGDEHSLRGRILNIASICGVEAWAGTSLYSASKHAMVGLTRALADEGAEKRIRVAAICPAMVATPMTEVEGPDYISVDDIARTAAWFLDLGSAAWPTEIVLPRRGAER